MSIISFEKIYFLRFSTPRFEITENKILSVLTVGIAHVPLVAQ